MTFLTPFYRKSVNKDPFFNWDSDFKTLFHALEKGPFASFDNLKESSLAPRIDVAETDTHIHIAADMPGLNEKDIEVSVDKNVLTLRGERKHEEENQDKKFHRVERFYGEFVRQLALPESVDVDNISAHFKNGVLEIDLPKRKEEVAKKKTIEVKTNL